LVVAGTAGFWWQHQRSVQHETEGAGLPDRRGRAEIPMQAPVKTPPVVASSPPNLSPATAPSQALATPAPAPEFQPITNVGTATATDAARSLLWAINGGDVKTVAATIWLFGPMRATVEKVFASLSAAKQAEFGSAEQMVATVLCAGPQVTGMQAVSTHSGGRSERSETGELVMVENSGTQMLRVRLQYADGRTVDQAMHLFWNVDRWRYVVNEEEAARVAATLGVPLPAVGQSPANRSK
jgi:hypothetical protein